MSYLNVERALVIVIELYLFFALGCLVLFFIEKRMDKREAEGKAIREQREREFSEEVKNAGMRVKMERCRYKLDKWESENHVRDIKAALMAGAERIDMMRSGKEQKPSADNRGLM